MHDLSQITTVDQQNIGGEEIDDLEIKTKVPMIQEEEEKAHDEEDKR